MVFILNYMVFILNYMVFILNYMVFILNYMVFMNSRQYTWLCLCSVGFFKLSEKVNLLCVHLYLIYFSLHTTV